MNVAFTKSLSRTFRFPHTFIYIDSYLGVAKFSAALFVSAQCQYFVWMRCDVCRATACWLVVLSLSLSLSDGPVISLCLCYVCHSFSFLHSTLKSCLSVSFTYCTFDVWPPSAGLLCCACDITALFSVLSQYPLCCFSVAAVLCEGYLAAICGFIFALSFGLPQSCCPHVIVCHDQGDDLFSLAAS